MYGVVALVMAALLGLLGIDVTAACIAQRVASASLGVPVKLDSLHLALAEPPTTVTGLTIGNPEGCLREHFVAARSVSIDATLQELSEEDITIPLVRIVGLEVDVERTASGGLNLSKMLEASKARARSAGQGGTRRRVRIAELELVDVTLYGGAKVAILPLTASFHADRITLRDVDSTATGLGVTDQLVGIVVDRVVTGVVEHFGDDIAGGVLDAIRGALGTGGDGGASAVDAARDAIGRLLGGKEEE